MSLFQVTKKQVIENYELRTMTGDIVSFTPSYSQLLPDPFSDLNVTVNVVATGGNGTPDNPNPIVGYSSANIVNTQNDSIVDLFSIDSDFRGTVEFNQLVNKNNIPSTTTINDITFTNNGDGSITVSGTASALASFNVLTEGQYMLISGHKYYVCGCPSNGSDSTYRLRFTSGSISETGNGTIFNGGLAKNLTCQVMNGYAISGTLTFKPQLFDLTAMFGSTIADYIYTLEQNNAGDGVAFFRNIYPENYYAYDSGTTEIVGKETPEATIAFGQTVYGGVLDVTRGKLSVTFLEFDLGTLTPVMYTVTEGNLFRYALDDLKPLASDYDVTNIICSNYPSVASASRANKTLSQVSNLLRFDIIDNDYNDAASMKTAMNGVQVVYPLAAPFDIDLTPVQIRALVGENNVFADCGKTTVTCLI